MEVWLFIVRIGVLLCLYLFLAAALRIIWRELQTVADTGSSPDPAQECRLIVVEAGETNLAAGESLAITSHTSLGRGLGNSLVLLDSSISARHAGISFRDGHWWLEDRDSTNGTTVNGASVRGEIPLRHDDLIGLGRLRLRFARS